MPQVEIGNLSIFYQLHGPSHTAVPPVILLHGLGSRSDDWELQLPALAVRRQVLAPDFRGLGRSSAADRGFRIGDLVGDVAAAARAADLGPAHWVGLSLGALVALQAAIDIPDQVRSLTLVNGFARLRLNPASAFSGAGRLALLLIGRMDWLGWWVARSLFPHESQRALRDVAAQRIGDNARGSYTRMLLAVARFDVRRKLPSISQPSLVVAGAEDRIVPMAAKRELAERLPHARLDIVTGSGHATPIDSAPAFNRQLVAFLTEVEE
jgi:3-oxoadipate enol-lactonase